MTQLATVTEASRDGYAVVIVARQTACGHDCEKCAGCGAQAGSMTVRVRTTIPVSPGDMVELYSGNRVLAIAALVYLIPVALFLLGYMVPSSLPEGQRYLCGGAAFVLGVLIAVLYDRHVRKNNKAVTFEIARKL